MPNDTETDPVVSSLEGAIKAASASGTGESGPFSNLPTSELISFALQNLPRFLEGMQANSARNTEVDQDLSRLRKEVRMTRKQLHELSQQIMLMREVQSAVVAHLERVQIMDVPEDDFEDEDFDDVVEFSNARGRSRSRQSLRSTTRR